MTNPSTPDSMPTLLGRYALYDEVAAGGMASVHLGRMLGPVGFARTVAIKRLHAQFAKDPEFVAMFLDEARLAARIRHPNVVSTVDVVATSGELFVVMEYIQGESLARLLRDVRKQGERIPLPILLSIMNGVLLGLHAAHEATSEAGEPLNIVHRDVSPQNILVGADGVARLIDFGVAKAASRIQTTAEGQLKGKFSYMAPEQIRSERVDRRVDVFAMGVVLWEALTGERLFVADNPFSTAQLVLEQVIPSVLELTPGLPPEIDRVVFRATERDRNKRFATARDVAVALEEIGPLATTRRVGEWVEQNAQRSLAARASRIAQIERTSGAVVPRGPVDVIAAAAAATQPSPQAPPPLAAVKHEDTSAAATVQEAASAPPPEAPKNERRAPPPERLRRAVAAAAVGAILAVVTWIAVARPGAPSAPSSPSASAVTASDLAASAVPVPPSSAATEAPSAAEPVNSSAVASATAPPSPPTQEPQPTSKRPAEKPRNARCNPPYRMDHGIRVPKPECF